MKKNFYLELYDTFGLALLNQIKSERFVKDSKLLQLAERGKLTNLIRYSSVKLFDLRSEFLIVMLFVPQCSQQISDRLAVIGAMLAKVIGDLKNIPVDVIFCAIELFTSGSSR